MVRPEKDLIRIPIDKKVTLSGNLKIPQEAQGLVLFAHGSGSSRHSPRNQYVAKVLNDAGLGTLLIDLLSEEEEAVDLNTGKLRFDIPLLGGRLVGIIDWLKSASETKSLSLGIFGASTGAAGALIAASLRPQIVKAVVSRGGRPDLAENVLPQVRAPTLLIVGGHDFPVIEMNQFAHDLLRGEKLLIIVPRATHLFEEPGALEEVAKLATQWFKTYLEKN